MAHVKFKFEKKSLGYDFPLKKMFLQDFLSGEAPFWVRKLHVRMMVWHYYYTYGTSYFVVVKKPFWKLACLGNFGLGLVASPSLCPSSVRRSWKVGSGRGGFRPSPVRSFSSAVLALCDQICTHFENVTLTLLSEVPLNT